MRQSLAALAVLFASLFLVVSIANDTGPFPLETSSASDDADREAGPEAQSQDDAGPKPALRWLWPSWAAPPAESQPEPDAEPTPEPVPDPEPTEPTDDTMPPGPEPTPEPAPEPTPEPTPQPTPEPTPQPTPEPATNQTPP